MYGIMDKNMLKNNIHNYLFGLSRIKPNITNINVLNKNDNILVCTKFGEPSHNMFH